MSVRPRDIKESEILISVKQKPHEITKKSFSEQLTDLQADYIMQRDTIMETIKIISDKLDNLKADINQVNTEHIEEKDRLQNDINNATITMLSDNLYNLRARRTQVNTKYIEERNRFQKLIDSLNSETMVPIAKYLKYKSKYLESR